MKERNTFDQSPTGAGGGAIEKSSSNDNMEIDDDEDFDLETPHSSKTQSLGNSGVTITPISHLNKVPFIYYVSTFIAKNLIGLPKLSPKLFFSTLHFT